MGLEQKGSNLNIDCANHSLSLPILLGGSGQENRIWMTFLIKKTLKFMVLEFTTMVTLESLDICFESIFNKRTKLSKFTKCIVTETLIKSPLWFNDDK